MIGYIAIIVMFVGLGLGTWAENNGRGRLMLCSLLTAVVSFIVLGAYVHSVEGK